jgi:ATP-dependent RNA helicase DDX5/DBP2
MLLDRPETETGIMTSRGAKSTPSPAESKVVEGWEYHTYSRGDPERYAYIGKDMSSDGATPAFLDYGNKATRAAADAQQSRYSSSGGGGGGSGGYGSGGGSYGGESGGQYNGHQSNAGGGRGGGALGANLRTPDWSRIELIQFQKDFYQEHDEVKKLSRDEVDEFRREHEITVSGSGIPNPVRTFEQSCYPGYLLKELYAAGFKGPTPIQAQGWPMALSGRGMIGVAETGSGKTLSFLLLGIVHINAQPLLQRGHGPIVLVLAPTRELANQIMSECSKLGDSSRIKYTCIYGGVPKSDQARQLREGVEVVIATPGRLIDFLESSTTNL